jgi:hypothetical protein
MIRSAPLLALLLLPAVGVAQQAAPSQGPPSRIARIVVSPVQKVVHAGDTLRLTAEARDQDNNVIPGVQFRWNGTGAFFEGRVDQTGLVTVRLHGHAAGGGGRSSRARPRRWSGSR